MDAAEQLALMRKLAPFCVLLLIAGIAGGAYLYDKGVKKSGAALLAGCTACVCAMTPGLLLLYLG